MKIKILTKKHNPLLKRREISFEVEHSDEGCTPSRLELRNSLANMLKIKSDLLFVERLGTRTGTTISIGEAHTYESPNQAILVEPEHIVTRNTFRTAENVDEPKKKEKDEEKIKTNNISSSSKPDKMKKESGEESIPPVEHREEAHDD